MAQNDIIKRTDHSQLPQGEELLAILKREAQRQIAPGKENVHFAIFDPIIDWLNALNLSTDFFTQTPEARLEDAIVMPETVQEELARATLNALTSAPDKLMPLLSRAASYLGESDAPEPSDLIYVFGAPGNFRIETAVQLYKQGLAPKILISGGRPFYKPEVESEAMKFQQYAIDNGIPPAALIIHDNAVSIADNVRGGLNKLDEVGEHYASMMLVTAWFVQRRCYAHMQKYVPDDIRLIRVNAPSNPTGGLTEDDWYKSEKGIKVIAGEYFKLRVSEILNTS